MLQTPGLLNNPKKPNWLGAPGIGSGVRTLQEILNDGSTVAWYRPGIGVTGTLNASAWANQILPDLSGPLLQATDAKQPIVLPWTGTNYAYLPGIAGNYVDTPDSVANSIIGDIDIRVHLATDEWVTSEQKVIAKANASPNIEWIAYIGGDADGKLMFLWSTDGTATVLVRSTAAVAFSDAQKMWVRYTLDVDNGAGGYEVKFYTSTDGVDWTQLGATVTGGTTTNIFDSNSPIQISSRLGASGDEHLAAKVYRVKIYNGINGTLAVDFNPALASETTTNGATFVAATGETWTLNNTGAKLAQIVASPQLLFGGVAHFLTTEAFVFNQPSTIYVVFNQITWTANDTISDARTAGIRQIYQQTTTPKIGLYAGTGEANGNGGLSLGEYGIVTALFSGASSITQVNAETAVTGNPGTDDGSGISLGAAGSTGTNPSNIQVKEIILRSAADSAATRLAIQQKLAAIHGIAL